MNVNFLYVYLLHNLAQLYHKKKTVKVVAFFIKKNVKSNNFGEYNIINDNSDVKCNGYDDN